MEKSSKTVAFIGIMGALVFVVLFLETYVFGVLIPIAPPCFLSISVAITISLFKGKKTMFIGGTILGICSLIIAFIIGNPAFIFPWISVLPRVFIGVVAYYVSVLIRRFTFNSQKVFVKDYLPYVIGAVFGVITNTVLTLSSLLIFKFIGIETVVATFIAINFPLEVVLSAILVPILINAVNKVRW